MLHKAEGMDLSVVLPVLNESDNLRQLLPRLSELLRSLGLKFEVIIVDGGSTDNTREVGHQMKARVIPQERPGFAAALVSGFAAARGSYVLTLDADMSHDPEYVAKMWRARVRADIIIASRYARGGVAYTSVLRRSLSRFLNWTLRRVLSMPIHDLSSGFRLYRREVLENLELQSTNFEVLEEILIKAYSRGFAIAEVPFTYFPRGAGRSHARLIRFGLDLARGTLRLWRLRNSIDSADYDERAFYSLIPMQRFWQRRRHRIVVGWARGAGRTLDVGCGSSVIIQSLNNAFAVELDAAKTRFLSRRGIPVTRASAFALPFKSGTFECMISSQVIEHVPFAERLFVEMRRVLRSGGILIIGTPDYATLSWRIIEPIYGVVMPGGYRHQHITQYTRESLSRILECAGFAHEETAYVAGSELIMRWRAAAPADLSRLDTSSRPYELRHLKAASG
jgi:glycosyltransferase involved in cell wall biosynthesis